MAFHSNLTWRNQVYLGEWVDLPLRDDGSETIKRGRQSTRETVDMPDHATCDITIDNTSGDWSMRNPRGQYYGLLKRNTPFRRVRILDTLTFSSTVSSGWPATAYGETWTLSGFGGSVLASDINSAAGAGTISTPVAGGVRHVYLAGSLHRNVGQYFSFKLPTSNITGDSVRVGLTMRGQSSSSYVIASAVISTADTIALTLGNETTEATSATTTLTNTGQWIRVYVNVENSTYRVRIWDPAVTDEPFTWNLTYTDTGTIGLDSAGYVGIQVGIFASNSNTMPFVVSIDDWELNSPRFYGVIPDFPRRWDVTARNHWIPTKAVGLIRLLANFKDPQSTLRRALPGAEGLVGLWPCEEAKDAKVISSAIPGHPTMTLSGTPDFAAFSEFPCSKPIPNVAGTGWIAPVPAHDETGFVQSRFLMHLPDTSVTDGAILHQIFTTGTASCWELIYSTGGNVSVRVFDPDGVVLHTQGPFSWLVDGRNIRVSYELTQNGSNVDYRIQYYEVNGNGVTVSDTGSVSSATCGRVFDVRFAVGEILTDVAFGHVTVQTAVTSAVEFTDEVDAFRGELAGDRLQRLLVQDGFTFTHVGALSDTMAMGPQGIDALIDQLDECVRTDGGTLVECVGDLALEYHTRTGLYDRPELTLNQTNKILSEPFEPTDDIDLLVNRAIVNNSAGGSQVAKLTTGDLSTEAPPDGAGPNERSYSVSMDSDADAAQYASFMLAAGTIDEERFPALGVDLARTPLSGDDDLSRSVLDLGVDDWVKVTNLQSRNVYEDLRQRVMGYTEVGNKFLHHFELVTTPSAPYRVAVVDDTAKRLDSTTSTLLDAITDSQTTFKVKVEDDTLWTTRAAAFPFEIIIGGEIMTVTGIAATAVPAYVATGTAAHADAASVSPGVPGGATGSGHTLLVWAGCRNAGATTNLPANWTSLVQSGSTHLFGKAWTGSDAVTVTFTGAVAGDTCSAQMASFSNLPLTSLVSSIGQGNGAAAQNIAIPALSARIADGIALILGRKSDDWTSVATYDGVSGAAEIGEPSSTAGNDQGLVWDYKILNGSANANARWSIPVSEFVVTGGTAQVSRSVVAIMGQWQTFTVTRGGGGFSAAHAAGTPVRVLHPWRPAL